MGLVYIEYISRRPEVDVATFHRVAAESQEGWESAYGEDQLLLNLGRTWRLGPEPEYLGVWYSPTAGLDRLDGWDRLFREGPVDHLERPFNAVARIDVAGCYEPLIEPVRARGGVYYAEYVLPLGKPAAVRAFYEERARHHPALRLLLLAQRIGRLAPEPGGLAIWQIPNFGALAAIADQLTGEQEPVALVRAGLYADLGQEIL